MAGDEFLLRVSDKGDGMTDATGAWGRGLGLPGLRGRVEAIGGTFALLSAAGEGTVISATFRRDQLELNNVAHCRTPSYSAPLRAAQPHRSPVRQQRRDSLTSV